MALTVRGPTSVPTRVSRSTITCPRPDGNTRSIAGAPSRSDLQKPSTPRSGASHDPSMLRSVSTIAPQFTRSRKPGSSDLARAPSPVHRQRHCLPPPRSGLRPGTRESAVGCRASNPDIAKTRTTPIPVQGTSCGSDTGAGTAATEVATGHRLGIPSRSSIPCDT